MHALSVMPLSFFDGTITGKIVVPVTVVVCEPELLLFRVKVHIDICGFGCACHMLLPLVVG